MNNVVYCRRGTDRAKLNNVQENLSHCHFVHHKSTRTNLESKPGRRGNRMRQKCKQYGEIHCPVFPDNRKGTDFFFRFPGVSSRPSDKNCNGQHRRNDNDMEKSKYSKKKLVLVPICLPKIQHVTIWD